MKKIYCFLTGLLLILSTLAYSQIGINTSTPRSTLDIVATDPDNPSNNTGVIIPRVTFLETTSPKEVGLLTFFNTSDVTQRGFYWWNGTSWNPFISINKVRNNKTITYVATQTSFAEGAMNRTAATDTRSLRFANVSSNDATNFQINTSGDLVVRKAGYYHIQAASFIKKNTNTSRRDQLDMKIYINGNNASLANAQNFNIEGSKSYPTGISTIAINASGTVKLNANDAISMKIIRSYRDTDPDDEVSIIPDPITVSNMTLRYMGNF